MNNIKKDFSLYYYHSNYIAVSILFVKENDLLKIYNKKIYDMGDDEVEYCFIIKMDELKKCLNVYYIYLMSLLLTDLNGMRKVIGDSEKFVISAKQNWKGMYFTKSFNDFYFSCDFEKLNIMDEWVKQQFGEVFQYYLYFVHDMNNYDKQIVLLNQMIEEEIEEIEKEIVLYEKYISKMKIYNLFIKKVLLNYGNDIIIEVLKRIIKI